jgi:hypothetical protein
MLCQAQDDPAKEPRGTSQAWTCATCAWPGLPRRSRRQLPQPRPRRWLRRRRRTQVHRPARCWVCHHPPAPPPPPPAPPAPHTPPVPPSCSQGGGAYRRPMGSRHVPSGCSVCTCPHMPGRVSFSPGSSRSGSAIAHGRARCPAAARVVRLGSSLRFPRQPARSALLSPRRCALGVHTAFPR